MVSNTDAVHELSLAGLAKLAKKTIKTQEDFKESWVVRDCLEFRKKCALDEISILDLLDAHAMVEQKKYLLHLAQASLVRGGKQ